MLLSSCTSNCFRPFEYQTSLAFRSPLITFLQNTTHSTRLDKTMVKFDLAMIINACYYIFYNSWLLDDTGDLNSKHLNSGNIWIKNFHLFAIRIPCNSSLFKLFCVPTLLSTNITVDLYITLWYKINLISATIQLNLRLVER